MSQVRFMSVRETSRETGIAESYIRQQIASNAVPGFYSGKKFNVDVPAFISQIEVCNTQRSCPKTNDKPDIKPTTHRKVDNKGARLDITRKEIRGMIQNELRDIVRKELRNIIAEELR